MPLLTVRHQTLGLLAGLACIARLAAGQADTHLTLRALDAGTGVPIAAANVVVDGSVRGPTDERGEFHVSALQIGPHSVTVRRLGYSPRAETFRLTEDSAANVFSLALHPIAIRLPAIVIENSTAWSALTSFDADKSVLSAAGGDAATMIRLARAFSGSTLPEQRILVNGVETSALPHAESISRITINNDPFSVAHNESETDVIEVSLDDSPRELRWAVGFLPGLLGRRNPLSPVAGSTERVRDAFISLPLPSEMVLTLSGMRARNRERRPILTTFGEAVRDSLSRTTSLRHSEALSLAKSWNDRANIRISFQQSGASSSNLESGGLVHWSSPLSGENDSYDFRVAGQAAVGPFVLASAIGNSRRASSLSSLVREPALTILETMVTGSPGYSFMQQKASAFQWTGTLRRPHAGFLVGWTFMRAVDRELLFPNPHGELFFGSFAEYDRWLRGERGGIRVTSAGEIAGSLGTTSAALFAERAWRPADEINLRAGFRADYVGRSWLPSPRLTAQITRGRTSMHSAVGIFRQAVPNAVLLQAARYRSNGETRRFIELGSDAQHPTPIYSEIDPALEYPASLAIANGFQVSDGDLDFGLEHSWTFAFSRMGSRRLENHLYMTDRLESNRRMKKHQLHARIGYTSAAGSVVAHYEWIQQRDDSEGPFAFPERQNEAGAEWARTAGISPHSASIVLSLPPSAKIDAALIYSVRSTAPMDVRSGADTEGLGLYSDRGGRRRNSGEGPAFRSLDMFIHKRVRIPFPGNSDRIPSIDLSVSAENLLDSNNFLEFGRSVASPYFGKPVAAMPGRSFQISFRLAR